MSFWTELGNNITNSGNGVKSYIEIGKGLLNGDTDKIVSGVRDAMNTVYDAMKKKETQQVPKKH